MPWYVYAFLAAIFVSFTSIIEKKILKRVHSTSFSASYSILNFVFSLPLLFVIDFSGINKISLLIILFSALLVALTFLLMAKALRKMEISTISPMLALNPGAAAVAGLIFLNEHLATKDIIGIFLMIIGTYIMFISTNHGFKHQIKSFFSNKEAVFVFLVIIFYALGAVLDRFLVSGLFIDPLAYLFFVNLFTAVIVFFISIYWSRGVRGVTEALKLQGAEISIISLSTIAYRYFELMAMQTAYVAIVSVIKRSSSFFMTVIGGQMFHEDKIALKATASVIIILGCLFVLL